MATDAEVKQAFMDACDGIAKILRFQELNSVFLDNYLRDLESRRDLGVVHAKLVRNILERTASDLTSALADYTSKSNAIQDLVLARLKAKLNAERGENDLFWEFLAELGPVIEANGLSALILPLIERLLPRIQEINPTSPESPHADRLRRLFGDKL